MLWNRHFIQGSLDLLSKRVFTKIDLLTTGYIKNGFTVSTMTQDPSLKPLADRPVLVAGNKTQSNKDLGGRSVEKLNSVIFIYMDSLINYIEFLSSPIKSPNEYTTNLSQSLKHSFKRFTDALQAFYKKLNNGVAVETRNLSTYFNLKVSKMAQSLLQLDTPNGKFVKILNQLYFASIEEQKSAFDDFEKNFDDEFDDNKGVVKQNLGYSMLQKEVTDSAVKDPNFESVIDFLYAPE